MPNRAPVRTTKTFAAGSRRHKLIIEDKTQSRGADGGVIDTWATILTVWGESEPYKTYELIQAAQARELFDARYRIPFPPSVTITPGMRLLDGSATYTITEVIDKDSMRRYLTLRCLSVAAVSDGGTN
jgi:SPP1 family predicted phage head-tail adaptor